MTTRTPTEVSAGIRLIDADTHYYEPDDCFTRYLDPAFRDRALTVRPSDDGLGRVHFGGRRVPYMSVSPSHFTAVPGALRDYLDGHTERPDLADRRFRPLEHPALVEDRDARLALMDRQGVDAAVILPTLGVSVEHDMRHDVPAACAAVEAFNRWVGETWGFGADGRIFGVAVLSLLDVAAAIAEVDRLLAAGARLVYLRAGPVDGRSPADPVYEPVWARLAEADAIVVLHIGNSGYQDLYSPAWSEQPEVPSHRLTALQHLMCQVDRPVADTLAAFVLQNLFGRFPGLRVMSIENGSAWISYLLHRMDKAFRATTRVPSIGGSLDELPSEVFVRHVHVVPFSEDDVVGLVRTIGADRVLLGSDYPHPEGLEDPSSFLDVIADLPTQDRTLVARGNAARLLGLEP